MKVVIVKGRYFEQKKREAQQHLNELIEKKIEEIPFILDSKDIAKILGVSRRYAYEIMDLETFPLIQIKSTKRVKRDDFFEWLTQQKR